MQFVLKMLSSVALSVAFVVCISTAGCCGDINKSPILLIPGFSKSQLNVNDTSNGSCDTNGESRNVWFNETLVELAPKCFAIQLKLNYSANYADVEGTTVTAIDFNRTSGFQFYFSGFLKYFVGRGYTAGVDIQIACYDWRLAPEQLLTRGYYANLQQLIQTMYQTNDNRKVTLVAHSMGGPISHYFLTRIVNQEWKDTYIHSYITLAGAWSGGNDIVARLISGRSYTIDSFEMQVGVQELRDLYRTWPSFYLLLPRATVWNDTVLVSTPFQNYTANDYRQLFADVGYPQGYSQFTEIDMEWPAPNVPTYCVLGLGVNTPMTFVYDDGFPNTPPITVKDGDGDNSVNRPSSEICLQWSNSGYPFKRTVLQGVNHSALPTDISVLQIIGSVVGAPVDPIDSVYTTRCGTRADVCLNYNFDDVLLH